MSILRTKSHVFPFPETDNTLGSNGMSRRELFAAMAMQGVLSDAENVERIVGRAEETGDSVAAVTSRIAVNCADALLAELAKEVKK